MSIDPEEFDDWFPTLVRYLGVSIIIGVTIKALFFGGIEYPSLLVAATGMILYKEVVRTRRDKKEDDNDERWTHLP